MVHINISYNLLKLDGNLRIFSPRKKSSEQSEKGMCKHISIYLFPLSHPFLSAEDTKLPPLEDPLNGQ